MRRKAERCAILVYKSINNVFSHASRCSFNRDIHGYNTRSRENLRKTAAERRWGHWTNINFAANEWNTLDLSLREAASLPKRVGDNKTILQLKKFAKVLLTGLSFLKIF